MSIGGIFGVMNTMFAAVSQRSKDIGVLRILGFSRLARAGVVPARIAGARPRRRRARLCPRLARPRLESRQRRRQRARRRQVRGAGNGRQRRHHRRRPCPLPRDGPLSAVSSLDLRCMSSGRWSRCGKVMSGTLVPRSSANGDGCVRVHLWLWRRDVLRDACARRFATIPAWTSPASPSRSNRTWPASG